MKRRNDMRARNHPAWWAFLVHRLSGLALAIFLPLHFLALSMALRGPAGIDAFLRFTDQPLFKLAEWGLVVLLALHMAGGIRLLLIEFRPPRITTRAMVSTANFEVPATCRAGARTETY